VVQDFVFSQAEARTLAREHLGWDVAQNHQIFIEPTGHLDKRNSEGGIEYFERCPAGGNGLGKLKDSIE